jgi:hypothetical protein
MLRWTQTQGFRWVRRAATVLVALAMAAGSYRTAFAMDFFSTGNKPVHNPGWPKGAAAVYNNVARVAERGRGDSGNDKAEFRGDTKDFNEVLADFAKVDAKTKRLVVHDGVGRSFMLNGGDEKDPAKVAEAARDWTFTVWAPADWERPNLRAFGMGVTNSRDAEKCPPPQIDVYTGGEVEWSGVTVPQGIEVSDERLAAHGFTQADGIVLEGKVVDLASNQPLAAQMRLEHIEDHIKEQLKDGNRYTYTGVAEATADAQGRWILKHAPEGWYRVVVAADGYVPRSVDNYYSKSDLFRDQPSWHAYNCGLSRAASVSGRVADEAGSPLADVEVRLDGGYGSTHEYTSKTDADGRFRLEQVPAGSATIRVRKSGYCHPGARQPITTPAEDVALNMVKSAQVRVTVDFAGTHRPETYIVDIEPENGAAIPRWGEIRKKLRDCVTFRQWDGEAAVGPWVEVDSLDANNQVCFKGVPPGKYVLQGWPSRYGSGGRDTPFTGVPESKPLAVDLKSGETAEITLPAK